ncbi:rCG64100, partial [Rattus norvegicus]
MNQCIYRGMEEHKERPKRPRQNNFSMFPSPKAWNFRGRKRKQSAQDEDAVSLCSLDIS